MRSHVQRTVAGCFAILRQLRSILRSVPSSVFQTLVVAIVLSRLDYGTATLAYRPICLIVSSLCSLLNAAARPVAGLRRSDHITDTLASFHWLRAPERIKFKLAVTVYRGIHGTAPQYLSDLLHRVSNITSRRRLRSSTSFELVIPLSRLVTVGDRSFAVAGPRLWNTLPYYICAVFTGVPAKTEDSFVSAILSGHCIVACVACCARWSLKFLLRPP